jgi:uncharacterized protein (DUF697 family)
MENGNARIAEASDVVKKHSLYSAGFGIVPLPLFNIAVTGASQLVMLSSLCKLYDVPFSKSRGKYIISSLIGGWLPTRLAYGGIGMLLGAVPLVGPAFSVLTQPGFGYASTYAIGMVFIRHLESGGTLLSLDPTLMKEHYAQEFQQGKLQASKKGKAEPGKSEGTPTLA